MRNLYFMIILLLSICSIAVISNSNPYASCPPGYRFPITTTNGCGPATNSIPAKKLFGLEKYIGTNFESCCNQHDQCYGMCGQPKKDCEEKFLKCMNDKCSKHGLFRRSFCKGKAFTYYKLVDEFGKGPFDEAQKEGCTCHLIPENEVQSTPTVAQTPLPEQE